MSYKTLEVELENGRVHPSGTEPLPSHAHALLTILTPAFSSLPANVSPAEHTGVVLTCAELADRWESLTKLPPDEASSFADDLEAARRNLPALKPSWD